MTNRMMIVGLTATIALMVTLSVVASDADTPSDELAPTGDIRVLTDKIGSCTTTTDKLDITLSVTLARNKRSFEVEIAEDAIFGSRRTVPNSEIVPLSEAIGKAAESLPDGSGKRLWAMGKSTVRTADNGGATEVFVVLDGASFVLDQDNARLLSTQLARADKVSRWIDRRTEKMVWP